MVAEGEEGWGGKDPEFGTRAANCHTGWQTRPPVEHRERRVRAPEPFCCTAEISTAL